MIAVFSRYQKDFTDLNPTPREMFVSIKSTESIRGRKFTGIIRMYGWYNNKLVCDAYDELKKQQPELFDK